MITGHAYVPPEQGDGCNFPTAWVPCNAAREEHVAVPPVTEVLSDGVTPEGVRWRREGSTVFFAPVGKVQGSPEGTTMRTPMEYHVTSEELIPAVQAWDAFAAQVRDTIIRKSAGYGNAWREQGYMGGLARVLSKTARLKNMVWQDQQEVHEEPGAKDESVLDTLVDLGALCAFVVANLEEGNRWGK